MISQNNIFKNYNFHILPLHFTTPLLPYPQCHTLCLGSHLILSMTRLPLQILTLLTYLLLHFNILLLIHSQYHALCLKLHSILLMTRLTLRISPHCILLLLHLITILFHLNTFHYISTLYPQGYKLFLSLHSYSLVCTHLIIFSLVVIN